MYKRISYLLIALVTGCGGAATPDSTSNNTPNNTNPNNTPTPINQVHPAGVVAGSADAVTYASGASPATPYSCSGNAIVDSGNTTVATCSGVYDTCSVCPLTNGASCVSSKPVCQGTLTLPDGQTIAFSSNGCNQITCSASMLRGFEFNLHSSSGSMHVHLSDITSAATFSDQSSAASELTWEGSSYSTKQGGPAGSIMFSGAQASPGSTYTLKVTAPVVFDTGSKVDQLTATLNVTGLITEQF